MKVSKNQNAVIIDNKLYGAKEVTKEQRNAIIIENKLYRAKENQDGQIKEYKTLCSLCDLHSKDCTNIPCSKSDRTDKKEIIFKFIRLINK